MPIRLAPTLRDRLIATDRPLAGMWLCTGSPLLAEIVAGGELDWVLIDMEHSPISLESVVAQLQAIAPYATTPVVRVPANDPVIIKQVLDLGAQTILVPMVSSAEEARAAVAAVRYPPRGMRGVGSALARSARWNRVDNYLADADRYTSLFVQIESTAGVDSAAEIAAVDGVDGVFVGPSDLAASMALLGQQSHAEVTSAVHRAFDAVRAAGKPVGVNAFDAALARDYVRSGANFLLVAADVAVLARAAESLAADWMNAAPAERESY
jgi:4-hydroxy-2-oxoheptanedioate aldolase